MGLTTSLCSCGEAPAGYPAVPLEARSASPGAHTILVVDDNAQNRALCEAALEDEGYRVIQADSGEAGVQAFSANAPDCVLLDVRMPGLDGFGACARIRALPGGSETPILFLTALRDVDTFDSALRAGADDFLTKPPFVQLEQGERLVSRAGRGLGLAFCRLAISALGGRIWVEDANPGAAFCIRLPHG